MLVLCNMCPAWHGALAVMFAPVHSADPLLPVLSGPPAASKHEMQGKLSRSMKFWTQANVAKSFNSWVAYVHHRKEVKRIGMRWMQPAKVGAASGRQMPWASLGGPHIFLVDQCCVASCVEKTEVSAEAQGLGRCLAGAMHLSPPLCFLTLAPLLPPGARLHRLGGAGGLAQAQPAAGGAGPGQAAQARHDRRL